MLATTSRRAAPFALIAVVGLIGSLALLAPAIVSAAPKHRPKPKPATTTTTPPADAGAGSGSDTATTPATPADTKPDTTDTGAKPATTTTAPSTPATPPTGAAAGSGSADNAQAEPDVDSLRQEYLSLRDELFKSRARASTVASQLYSTRVTIKLTYTTARFYGVSKSSIRLDGANVYENAAGAIAVDDGVRFDGYIAPGRHLITFHVEATGKDDDAFTSSTEAQIVVEAVAGKDLLVAARAKDSGDIAYQWKHGEHGSYGLGIDVAVKTMPRDDGKGGKAK